MWDLWSGVLDFRKLSRSWDQDRCGCSKASPDAQKWSRLPYAKHRCMKECGTAKALSFEDDLRGLVRLVRRISLMEDWHYSVREALQMSSGRSLAHIQSAELPDEEV